MNKINIGLIIMNEYVSYRPFLIHLLITTLQQSAVDERGMQHNTPPSLLGFSSIDSKSQLLQNNKLNVSTGGASSNERLLLAEDISRRLARTQASWGRRVHEAPPPLPWGRPRGGVTMEIWKREPEAIRKCVRAWGRSARGGGMLEREATPLQVIKPGTRGARPTRRSIKSRAFSFARRRSHEAPTTPPLEVR